MTPAVVASDDIYELGEGPAFDKEVNLEARQEHLVERPDDQFILTNGQNAQINSRQDVDPANP